MERRVLHERDEDEEKMNSKWIYSSRFWFFLINILQPFASHLIVELKAIMTKVATIMFFMLLLSLYTATKTTRTKLYSFEFEYEMISANHLKIGEAFF